MARMIRFYANENLSAVIVNELQRLGHDVLTSYEAGNANQRIPNEQVLETATADNRCIITFNRNDFIVLHRSGIEHQGIVICKDDRDRLYQAQIINEELSVQATLENRLFRVLKQNQIGSSQPKLFIQEYLRL
jgi:predicted nuclease of predicted toxin-antitoxin system